MTEESIEDEFSSSSSFPPSNQSTVHRHQRNTADVIANSHERSVRFPTSHLETNDVFCTIESWPNDSSAEERENRGILNKLFFCLKLEKMFRSWSRRKQIIVSIVVIFLLFAVAAATIVIILLIISATNNNHHYHPDIDTTTIPISTTTSWPLLNYLTGYVSKTSSKYLRMGTIVDSMEPFSLGFQFQSILYGFSDSSKTVFVIDAENMTIIDEFPLKLDLFLQKCDTCSVMSIHGSHSIICCNNCELRNTFRCVVDGTRIELPSKPIETRLSEDGGSLVLAAWNREPCMIQTIVVNGTEGYSRVKSTHLCPSNVTITSLMTTTKLNQYQMESIVDSEGSLVTTNCCQDESLTVDYHLNISQLFGMDTTISNENGLIHSTVIFTQGKLYITRVNQESGCVSVLQHGFIEFAYEGTFIGARWLQDRILIWYQYQNGINVAVFEFQWQNDKMCKNKFIV